MEEKILVASFLLAVSTMSILATAGSAPRFSFRDDFNYTTLAQLQAAGWTLCGGGPTTGYSVGNGILNLTNNGVTGASICYNNIPSRLSSWTVSAAGRWIGGNYGSIEIVVNTSSHIYRFDADGFYNQYLLIKDDLHSSIVFAANGYAPQLNTWHTLTLSGNHKTGITMYFDGQLVGNFQDPPSTDYSMTGVSVMAGWESSESWDWISATAT